MKTYVLYHGGCFDGFCAAWVARSVLKGEVEYIPVHYGQPPPAIEAGSRVYILDFCYPREDIRRMNSEAQNFVVLDHHETAQKELEGFVDECRLHGLPDPKIVFDMKKSGGRLAWEHFYGSSGMPSPGLVDYTEDRDLWRWALPGSRSVNACLRSYPLDFKQWDKWGKLSGLGICELMAEPGEAILRSEQQIVDRHVKNAVEVEMDGYKILAVNATVLISEIAGELAKGRPFGTCYFIRGDGKKIWSLRSSDEGADVSEIAKRHGGGGHRNAAGFQE